MGEKGISVQLIAPNKEISISQASVIFRLGLGKEKWNVCYQIISLPSFLTNLFNTRDRKGPILCIIDHGWWESILTILEKVKSCLVIVGLT